MSGIMRVPSQSTPFAIPYSGTRVIGDCILFVGEGEGDAAVVAVYDVSGWWYDEYLVPYFSDENNVISFNLAGGGIQGSVAFIPGPNHV